MVLDINLVLCIGCGLCHASCDDSGHAPIELGSDRTRSTTTMRMSVVGTLSQARPGADCIPSERIKLDVWRWREIWIA
jgi:ferredoxin